MIKQKPNLGLHRQVMFDMIKDIYASELKDKIAFKGGTLCMFLYELDRFSVDLDFDLKKGNIENILSILKKTTIKYGEISEIKKTKILINYKDGNYPLKVEINTRIKKNDTYEVKSFFGIPIICMDKKSMFANKLYTVYQRKKRSDKVASRDLYDIWFFFKNHREINKKLLEERSEMKFNDFLTFLKGFIIENYNKNNLLLGLGELVNEKQKYFIKNKLINEVLSQIDFYIRNSR